MAYHGPSYGLSAELKAKQDAKYDPVLENQARDWIQRVTGETVSGDFHTALKDGVILCKLANKVFGSRISPKSSRMPFMQMENINSFLSTISSNGVPPRDAFMTVDLYEAKNMGQVVLTIHAVARVAKSKGFGGPHLNTAMKGGGSMSSAPSDFMGGPSTVATVPARGVGGGGGGGGGSRFCSNCGAAAAGGKFCASCGNAL